MKLAINQPYIFPYFPYYQLVNYVDKFVIFEDVNFINKGWINRNNILVSGSPILFTIPLEKQSQNKLINEIKIFPDIRWKDKFLKTIQLSYKKAPYFNNIYPIIEQIILNKTEFISEMALDSLIKISEYLEFKTEFIYSSKIDIDKELKGQNKILEICKKENATDYINLIGGIDLYSKDIFKENNIKLSFLKSKPFLYKQFKNDFIPNLSIIDLLMFNSKDELKDFLNYFELV